MGLSELLLMDIAPDVTGLKWSSWFQKWSPTSIQMDYTEAPVPLGMEQEGRAKGLNYLQEAV